MKSLWARVAAGGAIVGAVLCAPGASRAQQRDLVALEWEAPPACPTKGEMLERIARIVGPDAAPIAPVRARVVVTSGAAGGVRAVLQLSAGAETDTREAADAACGALADALALILALAVTPSAGARPALAAPSRLGGAPSPASPPRLPPSTPGSTSPTSPASPPGVVRPAFRAGASALLDTFTFPSAAFGGEVAAGIGMSNALLEIDGALLSTQRIALASSPTEGATFTLVHAGLRGCYAVVARPVELAPCAGAGVDWIVAHGFGSQALADATGTVPVLTLGLHATIPLWAAFALRLGAEGLAPLTRPTFVIGDRGTVYQTSFVFFRASAGVEAHF